MALSYQASSKEYDSVILDPDLTDSNDIPAPKINYRISENSEKMLLHALGGSRELLEAVVARQFNEYGHLRSAGWHLCSRKGRSVT